LALSAESHSTEPAILRIEYVHKASLRRRPGSRADRF